MTIDLTSAIVTLVVGAISVAIAFYVKDYLERRSAYSKLEEKLHQVAGKKAQVLYSMGASGPAQLYTIKEFDRQGVTLEGELQTIFVPTTKLLESEWVLPNPNYDQLRLAKMRKDAEESAKAVVTPLMNEMMDQMLPRVFSSMKELIEEDDSDISVAIGMKFSKLLKEEGVELKRARLHVKPQILPPKTDE